MEQAIPNPDKNSPPSVPSVEAVQAHLYDIEQTRQDAKDMATKAEWQKRVEALEQELQALKAHAQTGDYRVKESEPSPEKELTIAEQHRAYQHAMRQRCIVQLAKLSLSSGDSCRLHSLAEYNYYVGMGEGSIYRKVERFLAKLSEGWLYIVDEQSIEDESDLEWYTSLHPSKPGYKKYFLNPSLEHPALEEGNRLQSLDFSLEKSQPSSWSEVSNPIFDFVTGVRLQRFREKAMSLVENSPKIPVEQFPASLFTQSVTLVIENGAGHVDVTGLFRHDEGNSQSESIHAKLRLRGRVEVTYRPNDGEPKKFDLDDSCSQSWEIAKKLDVFEELLK